MKTDTKYLVSIDRDDENGAFIQLHMENDGGVAEIYMTLDKALELSAKLKFTADLAKANTPVTTDEPE